MAVDYYVTLGVARNATTMQIRERFRQLVRERHPDRYKGEDKSRAEREFQTITQAFNVLVNPDSRRQHDQDLAEGHRGTQGRQPGEAAKVYMQRGVKAFREERYLEAAENFNRATQERPENARAWYSLARTCQLEERWLPRAVTAILRACELEPMNAEYLTLAGRILSDADDPVRAAEFYRKSLVWGADEEFVREELKRLDKRTDSASTRRSRGRS